MNQSLFRRNFFQLLFIFVIASCNHDSNLSTLPEIKFEADVRPTLIANCALGGCHGSGSNREKFSLVTYDDVINSGTISEGDPRSSSLYKAIANKSKLMPPAPNAPLTDLQISLIYVWISQGAKNN